MGLQSKNRAVSHAQNPGAGADVFPTAVRPAKEASILRFFIVPGTDSVVSVAIDDGTDVVVGAFEDGATLTAGQTYAYDVPCTSAFTYNLRFTDAQVGDEHVACQEIQT